MQLWSVQTAKAWAVLRSRGILHCDARFADRLIRSRYPWLIRQMERRIGVPPPRVRYPLWAWYRFNGKHARPDLRYSMFRNESPNSVLLELELPDNAVLLSNEDTWHCVLNNWLYFEESWPEEKIEKQESQLEALPSDQRQSVIEKSWEPVLNDMEHSA